MAQAPVQFDHGRGTCLRSYDHQGRGPRRSLAGSEGTSQARLYPCQKVTLKRPAHVRALLLTRREPIQPGGIPANYFVARRSWQMTQLALNIFQGIRPNAVR